MAINLEGTALRVLTLEATNFETVTLDGVVFARKPTITTQPVGGTINDNQSHAMSVVADGLGTALTYQWFMDGGAISGATGASYTFTPAGNTTNRTFFCQVAGFGGGNTQTSTVTVTVNPSWVGTNTQGNADLAGGIGFFVAEQVFGSLEPRTIPGMPGVCQANYWFRDNTGGATNIAISDQANDINNGAVWTQFTQNDADSWSMVFEIFFFLGIPTTQSTAWYSNTGAPRPIRVVFAANKEAADVGDYFYSEVETYTDYQLRHGVHRSQRPDLYEIPENLSHLSDKAYFTQEDIIEVLNYRNEMLR
ncbi:Ig-like domain-containing protein [Vibrio crassostreae]|uniref:Uncharacterized protein n=1 Tax=Vibrio crassostreae TaxID=246167 RepID=A0A822MWP0_9VIBR|nr:hypothetical protein [Vibrio crassostreae]CAH6960745.1 hypothetical protein VCHA35P150_30325 [Vibrio chagasii]MDH5950443.1 hypothetical protein [Vibrio crassostreae]TCN06115.1 hypothetical protein EDB35_11494 [Vibrio crassostreae]TCU05474.1 hypothetical protein EDB32_11661 [Vibrio crassostreae]CAH7285997.1 hypothetical protein VCHA39O224_10419 [Vibrio chagasii]